MSTLRLDVNDPHLRDRFFRDHLGQALAALEDGSWPRWGGMTAQQMVEHLQWGFELSTGRAAVDCTVPEARRERFKSFLRDNTPMMHEFRNPALAAGLPPLRHSNLAEAKEALAIEVGRFLDDERSAPSAFTPTRCSGPSRSRSGAAPISSTPITICSSSI